MKKKVLFGLLMVLLVGIILINLIDAAIDPALIFCRDAGYDIEDRDDGPYCISSEGIGCNVWGYHCKCYNESCFPNMNYTKVELCELPCPEISCINEGEINTIYECCEGLKQIPCDELLEDGSCSGPMIGPQCSICSDCGNGNCEEWENICNCPEDCRECSKQGEIMEAGGCCPGLQNIPDSIPDPNNLSQCLDMKHFICVNCSNNKCEEGENKCNCPEDCEGIIDDEDEEIKFNLFWVIGIVLIVILFLIVKKKK